MAKDSHICRALASQRPCYPLHLYKSVQFKGHHYALLNTWLKLYSSISGSPGDQPILHQLVPLLPRLAVTVFITSTAVYFDIEMPLIGWCYRDFSWCEYQNSEDENCLNLYGKYAPRAIEPIVHDIADAAHISMADSFCLPLRKLQFFFRNGTSLSRLSKKITLSRRKALNISWSALTRVMSSWSSFRWDSSPARRFVSMAQEGTATIAIKVSLHWLLSYVAISHRIASVTNNLRIAKECRFFLDGLIAISAKLGDLYGWDWQTFHHSF